MATMIPVQLPSRRKVRDRDIATGEVTTRWENVNKGERDTFALLRRLPDSCLCYWEPVVRERYPDFIAIIPELGVLVIEVKGWTWGQIRGADSNTVTVARGERTETHKHPVRQARDYMNDLRDKCRQSPRAAVLMNSSGAYNGNFRFPFAHVAIMSNMDRSQIDRLGPEMADVFPRGRVIAKDEFAAVCALPEPDLVQAIRSWFNPSWKFPSLSAAEVNVLRGTIHPEIKISGDLGELDTKQEEKVRLIGDGHRIMYGVAGSGKTVILLARAKLLAQDAGAQILLLCFNKPLAAHFRRELAEYPNIHATHFHEWASRQGVYEVIDPMANDERTGEALLARLHERSGDSGRFDAVMIDEGQDFHPTWFRCAVAALSDSVKGDLLVALDGAQNLYRRRKFTWVSVGISARGNVLSRKTYDLDRNYRNTRQIVTLAAPFAALMETEDEDGPTGSIIVDPGSARRDGPFPKCLHFTTRTAECAAIIESVGEWLERGITNAAAEVDNIRPEDIAILYPSHRGEELRLTELLLRLQDLAPVRHVSSDRGYRPPLTPVEDRAAITVSTLHSSKGLQFKVVVIIWTDLLAGPERPDVTARDRPLLYVGMTRSEKFLTLSWTGGSPLTDEIVASLRSLHDA